jgi:uncharacterized protein (DUF4415 family)
LKEEGESFNDENEICDDALETLKKKWTKKRPEQRPDSERKRYVAIRIDSELTRVNK